MKRKRVEIWGIYPPPIGGISIYCKRLTDLLHQEDETVIMRNFARSDAPVTYVRKVRFALLEFLRLPFVSKRIIHVQFRNVFFLFLLALLGWRHDTVITLHNRKMLLLNGLRQRLMTFFFKRVKTVIFNDPTYKPELLAKYHFDANKVVVLPTFIPPAPDELKGLTEDMERFIAAHDSVLSANASILIRNVWGDVYGFDQMIELMNRLVNEQHMNVGLLFLLSEIGDVAYYDKCMERIHSLHLDAHFMMPIQSSVNGFEVWAKTDVFLRPTMTDMEGISVKEALLFGTPVVASSVCSRPKEAVLFEPGNVDDLFYKVLPLLHTKQRVTYVPEYDVVEMIRGIYRSLQNK